MYVCHKEFVHLVDDALIHGSPSDDEHPRGVAGGGVGRLHRVHAHGPLDGGPAVREHDIAASGQRPPDGAERRPAHDHRAAHRGPLEELQVLAQVPGHRPGPADGAVCGDRYDQALLHRHTATGALMAGQGS